MGLLCALAACALLGWPSARDWSWGFRYPSLLAVSSRIFLGVAVWAVVWPPSHARLRSALCQLPLGRLMDPGPYTLLTLTAVAAFIGLATIRPYGDSHLIVQSILDGQVWTWKEPLAWFANVQAYRWGSHVFHWSPQASLAAVSVLGGIWWCWAARGVALTMSDRIPDRALMLGLLLTPGVMQLFFGHVENYALVSAAILTYVWAAIAFLRGRAGFAAPCLSLAVAFWIHLLSAWLIPSLVYLFWVGVRRPELQGAALEESLRLATIGILAWLGPTTVTVGLGLAVPNVDGLNFATFGGVDHSLFVPLFAPDPPTEKWAFFEPERWVALVNQLLLVAGACFCVVLAYLGARRKTLAIPPGRTRFLLLSTLLLTAFVVTFNPDMAVYDVGLRAEWDLLSPPGIVVPALAGALLLERAGETERTYVGLTAVTVSAVLTGSWVLYNAGWLDR